MDMPCRVQVDLRKKEQEEDEAERLFDPADLSEVTEEEVDAFLEEMPAKTRVELFKAVRDEQWDDFSLVFRAGLIEFRTDV